MGTATAPQPALPHDDDLGWLIAAYAAQLAEVRQEMAEARREIIAAKAGRSDVNALTLLELRMADRNGILLDFERKLDEMRKASATLRARDEVMEMRRAMLDPVPEPARPVRRRRRAPGRHAAGQGELFAIDGAKTTAPALLPLAGLGAWSRHAAAVKLTAGGVAAGFAVASVAAGAAHREPFVMPWSPPAPQHPPAVLAPALPVPLDPDAPLLARTFPASYPGKHHKPATVTLTAPSLTVPVPADPAPDPSLSQTSGTSGTSQSSDWSQSPGSSQQDQWSQQDQRGSGGNGGNWQQDNQQGGNWQNASGQNDQGEGWQQGQRGGWDKGSGLNADPGQDAGRHRHFQWFGSPSPGNLDTGFQGGPGSGEPQFHVDGGVVPGGWNQGADLTPQFRVGAVGEGHDHP